MHDMETKTLFTVSVATAILALSTNPGWGVTQTTNPTASDANYNTAGGTNALLNTTGTSNTVFGDSALRNNTTGNNNTASGGGALFANTTGYSNVANGNNALYANTIGFNNSAIGYNALAANTTGNSNNAIGQNALTANTTGVSNTANGNNALASNTTGNYNTAYGQGVMKLQTTGSNNTAVGWQALRLDTTDSSNIALGYQAGYNLTSGGNNIYIGNAGAVGGSENNTIYLGGSQTSAYLAGVYSQAPNNSATAVPVYIDSTGKLGTVQSSQRYKDDIRDMSEASRRLLELRPVTFHYKQPTADGSKPLEYGLIAEEVAKVYPDLVVRDKDGQVDTVQYQKLTPMLLNEVQRLNRLLLTQSEEIVRLKQQMVNVQTQAKQMQALAVRLSRLEAKEAPGPVADASEAVK